VDTLSDAIAFADPGDSIFLLGGTHYANIVVPKGKDGLRIHGSFEPGHPKSQLVITRGVYTESPIVIDHLWIDPFSLSRGDSVFCSSYIHPETRIESCTIRGVA